MSLLITTAYFRRLCIVDSLRLLVSKGFDSVELNFSSIARCETSVEPDTIVHLCRELGVRIEQVHAPYPWMLFGKQETRDPLKLAEKYCSILAPFVEKLSPRVLVFHPLHRGYVNDTYGFNRRFFDEVKKRFNGLGLTLALENLVRGEEPWCSVDEVSKLAEELEVHVCLDVGHAYYAGQEPSEAAEKLLKKRVLATMHIHDNYGSKDLHLLPFMGRIRWGRLVEVLRRFGYKGNLVVETGCDDYVDVCLNRLEILKFMRPYLENLHLP